MNEQIMQAARELGEMIAQSDEYKVMQYAEDAALDDKAMQAQYHAYTQIRQNLQNLLSEENPDHAQIGELSSEVDRLQQELQQADTMQTLQQARQAFAQLMEGVNAQLQAILAPQEEGSGCPSGGCHGCHGCGVE